MTDKLVFYSFIAQVLQSFEQGDFKRYNLDDQNFTETSEIKLINTLKAKQQTLLGNSSTNNTIAFGGSTIEPRNANKMSSSHDFATRRTS